MATHGHIGIPCTICGFGAKDPEKFLRELKNGFNPDNGRFIITDMKTGRRFIVEPIDDSQHPADWGDVNPSSKKIEGHYGEKHIGSIKEEDSIITKENGFKNWVYFKGSPEEGIRKLLEIENEII